MPTVLMILGWRFSFYANEGNEPPHIHCRKGDADAKYWLVAETFEVIEAYAYNLSMDDRRAVRKIIFEHFDYIMEQWVAFKERMQ